MVLVFFFGFLLHGNSVCQHYYDKIVSIEVDKTRKCVCSMCHLNSAFFSSSSLLSGGEKLYVFYLSLLLQRDTK